MKSKLISFILALCLLISIPVSALYKYNPFTRKLDYYEPVSGSDLGDLGDVTLTGLATGNVLYYNGTAWVNLATGANTNVLTLAGGVPTWAAPGAPAAHAASHEVGGADLVDHDQLTNYLAAQHLTLPNTLAAVLTDHNLAAHTAIGIPNPANVFYVSATGGDYTTIQAALTAQNAGGETFLVGPGTYTDTIHFSANDQVVKPLGHAANVIVTQADANIVDGGVHTDCIVESIEIRLTAPTTAINAIQVGTGTMILIECRGYLATAVALVAADQPSLIGFTGAGTIRIKRGNYQYYHTGNTGAGGIKAAFRANVNLAELHLHKIDVVTITNSGTALATAFFVTTGTAITEVHNVIDCVVTDPNSTLVVGLGYVGGAGSHNVQGNHVDVVATNNTSYGLYHNGTATIRSALNAIHASDVAGSSYAFFVGASATLNSHFDDLRSDDGNNIAGTFVQVSSPADGDLGITDELDVIGASEFSGDTTQYEDVFMTWGDAADHMVITQNSEDGTEGQALISIIDDREGATAQGEDEATLRITAADGYAFVVNTGNTLFADSDVTFNEDVFVTWAQAADHMRIIQGNAAGIEGQALIYINDDRIGATANEADEATIHMTGEGPDSWAIYADIGKVEWSGDVRWTWGSDVDNADIIQNAVAGIEDVPLINIADARTGATANELSEATIHIDAEGYAALYVKDGISAFGTSVLLYATSGMEMDNVVWTIGAHQDWLTMWDSNGAGDDLVTLRILAGGATTTAMWYSTTALNPSGMTDHDNYLSPTFVMVNDEGADANDYSGVVIGERAQADVKVAHYFDFYAMTGSADGSVDTADELAAIFRFGASGTGVPDYATTGGDALFEGAVEVDGVATHDGLFGFGTVVDLTIDAGGDVTVTKGYHKITVNGGTGSGADDLDTIAGGSEGQIIVIRAATNGVADTVTVKDGVDNLELNGDFVMDHVHDSMTLLFNGTGWIEMSRSDNE